MQIGRNKAIQKIDNWKKEKKVCFKDIKKMDQEAVRENEEI